MNRQDFPFLAKCIYLDNAATMLKPTVVVDFLRDYYLTNPVNLHSSESKLGRLAYGVHQNVRKLVADFVGAKSENVIFNEGTTRGLNDVAQMLAQVLQDGDEIVLSNQEHASNILPWIDLSKRIKLKLVFATTSVHRALSYQDVANKITPHTRVVSLASVTNVKGSVFDFAKLRKLVGPKTFLVCDAAQAIAHTKVNFQKWDLDFLVFSGTKLYGPYGAGALVMKTKHIEFFHPPKSGGGSYSSISPTAWQKKVSYEAFEAGTPNTPGIAMLGEAIKYLNKIGTKSIFTHEKELLKYTYEKFRNCDKIKIYTSQETDLNFVFNVQDFNSQDVAGYLGSKNILIRGGRQCAPLLYDDVVTSACRISYGLYNEKEDIDKVYEEIIKTEDFLDYHL